MAEENQKSLEEKIREIKEIEEKIENDPEFRERMLPVATKLEREHLMAETPQNPDLSQYATREQIASLRVEVQGKISELNQEVAVLKTSVEAMGTRIEQEVKHMSELMVECFNEVNRNMDQLRQDCRNFQGTSKSQLWTLVVVVCVTILGGLIKLVFFSTPPTP